MRFSLCYRRIVLGVCLVVPAGLALAEPPAVKATTPPSPEERQKYSSLLEQGRRLESANNLPGSAKALTECLTLVPDDPRALSELGYVQYRSGDLVQAEATTRKAVARAEQPELRAASLYNLALILSAKKSDPAGAVAALEQSLRLRQNKAVESMLEKLDPKAVARVRAGISLMTGPVAADDPSATQLRKQICWKSLAETWPDLGVEAGDAKERIDCTFELKVKLPPGSPFLDVRIWKSIGGYNWPKQADTLAIRTTQGWYLHHFDSIWGNRWESGETKILSAEVSDLGGRKVLMLRWQRSSDSWMWGMDSSRDRYDQEGRLEKATELLIAGIGPAGTPSITAAIPIAADASYGDGRDKKRSEFSAQLAVSFSAAGGIVLSGPTVAPTKVPKKKYADLLPALLPGTFPIELL